MRSSSSFLARTFSLTDWYPVSMEDVTVVDMSLTAVLLATLETTVWVMRALEAAIKYPPIATL